MIDSCRADLTVMDDGTRIRLSAHRLGGTVHLIERNRALAGHPITGRPVFRLPGDPTVARLMLRLPIAGQFSSGRLSRPLTASLVARRQRPLRSRPWLDRPGVTLRESPVVCGRDRMPAATATHRHVVPADVRVDNRRSAASPSGAHTLGRPSPDILVHVGVRDWAQRLTWRHRDRPLLFHCAHGVS